MDSRLKQLIQKIHQRKMKAQELSDKFSETFDTTDALIEQAKVSAFMELLDDVEEILNDSVAEGNSA